MDSNTWGNSAIERKIGGVICWIMNEHEQPWGLTIDHGDLAQCCRRCKKLVVDIVAEGR